MRLLVDVGNSRIKAALESEAGLQALPALPYKDEALANVLSDWGTLPALDECWVASVGHADICEQIENKMTEKYSVPTRFATSVAESCGIRNAYAQPGNLGVDRLLGMIAARAESQFPAVIVSAGTAVTIDAVDATGQHLGGLIAPGLGTQRKAMLEHTQVRADTSSEHIDLLGDSTDACVTLGTLHTVVGYIERVVGKLQEEQKNWTCVISGGDAELLLPQLGVGWAHRPMLVLEGLAVLAKST